MASRNTKRKVLECLSKGCDESFETQSGRSKHHKKCTKPKAAKEKDYNEVEGGIQCKECNSILSSESNFYQHRRTVHATNKKTKTKKMHKCLVCSKEFEKQSKLTQHELTHMKNHKCQYCNKVFKR